MVELGHPEQLPCNCTVTIPFLNSLTSIGIAQFYNVILPARMGEVVRVYFLSKRHKIKKTTIKEIV